jgi:hypothetical protein
MKLLSNIQHVKDFNVTSLVSENSVKTNNKCQFVIFCSQELVSYILQYIYD